MSKAYLAPSTLKVTAGKTGNSVALTLHFMLPSKKNCKVAIGKNRMIIDRKVKSKLDLAEIAIVSAFRAFFQTLGDETSTELRRQSWTSSHLPEDDCWEQVPELAASGKLCASGDERIEIVIEKLPPLESKS